MKQSRVAVNRRVLPSAVLSVLMVVAGARAIFLLPETSEGLTALVGWLLVLTGATDVAHALRTRDKAGHRLAMILVGLGIVCIVAGGYVLVHPLMGFAPLTFVWLIYLLGKSLLGLVFSYRLRPLPGASWLYFDGIANSFILGMILLGIWTMWPVASTRVIGILVGISMLFSGVARLMVSLAPRRAVETPHEECHEAGVMNGRCDPIVGRKKPTPMPAETGAGTAY
jgi:uncharacterized membrane protein HdeD (DUF308 family)